MKYRLRNNSTFKLLHLYRTTQPDPYRAVAPEYNGLYMSTVKNYI